MTTIHLSVRPAGWASAPPNVPAVEPLQQSSVFSSAFAPSLSHGPSASAASPSQGPVAISIPTHVQSDHILPFVNRIPTMPLTEHRASYHTDLAAAPPLLPVPPVTAYTPSTDPSTQPNGWLPHQQTGVCLGYITYTHQAALQALATGHHVPPPPNFDAVRGYATRHLSELGWSWPDIFDRSYPPVTPESGGVKYELDVIE
jgi:hypothetical protein